MVIAERCALLALALGPESDVTALGVVLGVLFVARIGLRARARMHVERTLFARTVDATLDDVALGVPRPELEAIFFSGIESLARAFSQAPELLGEFLAMGVVTSVVARVVGPSLWVVVLVASSVAVGVLFAFRRTASYLAERYWTRYQRVIRRIEDVLGGQLELVASGFGPSQARVVLRELRTFQTATGLLGMLNGVVARLPLVGVVVAVAWVALLPAGRTLPVRHWLALGALLPPWMSASVALSGAIQSWGALASVAALPPVRRRPLSPPPKDVDEIRVRNASVALGGVTVLEGVDLSLRRGELTVVVGKNGSGKTTLLKALIGVLAPAGGQVDVGRVALADLDREAWRTRLHFMSQSPYLTMGTVRDALRFVAPDDVQDAALTTALEAVGVWSALSARGLGDALATPTTALSAGERQKVALARALVRPVDVYLFDEPDINLDEDALARLGPLLRGLAERAIVVAATHAPRVIEVAERVITLERGRVVADERRTFTA